MYLISPAFVFDTKIAGLRNVFRHKKTPTRNVQGLVRLFRLLLPA
jgi:hypothetical protein